MAISNGESDFETLQLRGIACVKHTWKASTTQPRGVCVLYHGFLAHSQYPTVRYAAEVVSAAGFDVIAVDLPGHGKSPGLRGYISSADDLVEDGVTVAEHVLSLHRGRLPIFLVGSSMGGCIALAVSLNVDVTGVVLLAPMLAIDVAEPARYLLRGISAFGMGSFALIPSSATSSEKQYRDPDKRRECDQDELVTSGGNLRCASASSCIELASRVHARFSEVSVPFFCMIANDDVVVDNKAADELIDKSPSPDKTIEHYDALHGLLCEPSPLVDKIQSDMVEWLNKRALSWQSKNRTSV